VQPHQQAISVGGLHLDANGVHVNHIVAKDDQGHLLALGLPIVGGDQQWSAHTSYNPVAVQTVGLKRSATYERADSAPTSQQRTSRRYPSAAVSVFADPGPCGLAA